MSKKKQPIKDADYSIKSQNNGTPPQQGQSEQQSANNPSTKSTNGSDRLILALNAVILALNGTIGYWGFNSAKNISDMTSKAKSNSESIEKIKEVTYEYALKELDRDLNRITTELKGLEFVDDNSKHLKDELQQDLNNVETLNAGKHEVRDGELLANAILKFDARQFDESLSILHQIKNESAEQYYIEAAIYFHKNDLKNADIMIKKMVEYRRSTYDPLMAKAYTGQGAIELQNGNIDKAISKFQDALISDPTHFPAKYDIADAYSRKNNVLKAIHLLCEFQRMTRTDVVKEIETDIDPMAFTNLKTNLGVYKWETELRRRLATCR